MNIPYKKQKSVMKHQFAEVPNAEIQRSRFDRSHGHTTAFDAGKLIPIYCDEALPGDTHSLNASAVGRLTTMLYPVLDNARVTMHFFAVPVRLIWDNFRKFMGEQTNPGDSTDYLIPQVDASDSGDGEVTVGSIADYMGIQPGYTGKFNALHLRAYNLIYNEWYRDENLIESLPVNRGDGPDSLDDYYIMKRCKRHDYFTSALPWPQKGDAVNLPLGDSAPILQNGEWNFVDDDSTAATIRRAAGSTNTIFGNTNIDSEEPLFYGSGLIADLSSATAATINSLRQAFQLQKMFERDARGGTRYAELIKSHFNVTSPDARLQRPEYLGGGSADMQVSPVPATAGALGDLGATGTVMGTNIGFSRSFTEHCVIIGIACVTSDMRYQAGIDRMYNRRTRYDFYWPALAHLGEQEILNRELFVDNSTDDDEVFGYQERYAEYRHKTSQITGVMRSLAPTSLDAWHLAQQWATHPTLSQSFIEENPPFDRVVQVTDEPHMRFDFYFNLFSDRPMPVYSVPGQIDHF